MRSKAKNIQNDLSFLYGDKLQRPRWIKSFEFYARVSSNDILAKMAGLSFLLTVNIHTPEALLRWIFMPNRICMTFRGLKIFDYPWHEFCTLYFLFNKLAKLIRCDSYCLHKGFLSVRKIVAKGWQSVHCSGWSPISHFVGFQVVTKWKTSRRQIFP